MTREIARIQFDIPEETQALAERLRQVIVETRPTGLALLTAMAIFFRTVSEQWATGLNLPAAPTLHERFPPEDQLAITETLAVASERGLLERPLTLFAAFSAMSMQAVAAACDPEHFAPPMRPDTGGRQGAP